MSDIQIIIQSVVNANDQGKDFLREVKKIPKPKREKLLEAAEKLYEESARLSETARSIKKAVSPKKPFVVAMAKANDAQKSEEVEKKLGGREKIVVPASSLGSVKGHEFCVTGEVEGRSREEMEDLIKSHGGKVHTGITKRVDVLVIGIKPGSKKVPDARKLGIDIVDAVDFIKWVEKG